MEQGEADMEVKEKYLKDQLGDILKGDALKQETSEMLLMCILSERRIEACENIENLAKLKRILQIFSLDMMEWV